MFKILFVLFLSSGIIFAKNKWDFNLPDSHFIYYFNSFPVLAEKCKNDSTCPYKDYLDNEACWGYELNCTTDKAYSMPSCPGDHKGWVSTKKAQLETFYAQGDFGYIREQLREMTLLCKPLFIDDSSLECTNHMRFCRGRNIFINFTNLVHRNEPIRYKMDVLANGDIGGYCSLDENKLKENADHISPLQSWGPEIRNFKKLPFKPKAENQCDVVIDKPTYVLKIDAAINMYHHFCDFFNLYASLHLNLTHESVFDTDNHILIWESFSYHSAFQDTFQAFSKNPIWDLKTFRGKSVCFKNIVFPLLPRMIFGLYYNTPLIYGCEKSGLFKSFSEFILHRLRIPLHKRNSSKIRITLLSRNTQYRNIINENELVTELEKNSNYEFKKVVYNKLMPFKMQLEITRNTDIFIGMHGAGLTHFLFLPDWAVGFELYNCEDATCYKDLARLRGIKYMTWRNETKLTRFDPGTHPQGGAHAKFINYSFDIDEFKKIIFEAVEYVKNNEHFKNFLNANQIFKENNLKKDEL